MRFAAALIVASSLVNTAVSLNILLSTTDSWVSKNVRLLYSSLTANGHNVLLVAPLYNTDVQDQALGQEQTQQVDSLFQVTKRDVEEESSIKDGGEFGHLLPVHQTYYKNILKINQLPKRAKNVVRKEDLTKFESTVVSSVKNTKQFGQDPLDSNIWYVNSTPLNSLLVAFDVIIPKFKTEFKPDVVIVGPNEGLSLTTSNNENHTNFQALSMIQASVNNNLTTIGLSTEDNHHIYYQDEKFFNIQSPQILKQNVFGRNINFINKRVNQLLEWLSVTSPKEVLALNINFPSINHQNSRCITSNAEAPDFHHVESVSSIFPPSNLPKFELKDKYIELNEEELLSKTAEKRLTKRDDLESDSTFVDKRSYYYVQNIKNHAKSTLRGIESIRQFIADGQAQLDEMSILKQCGISVIRLAVDRQLVDQFVHQDVAADEDN
ncbi:acid phosphatase-like protein [Scheffersomyces xylosifermentans]|uniref:acid phosphatase-like protein n=1 Tax=Scheffersomyces xylosifermentans TaxID=1304137 RepID=UPI00315D7602